MGAIGEQVVDFRLMDLAVTVHAAVALLESEKGPGDVEVDEAVGLVVEVDAFGGDVRGDHEADRAVGGTESFDGVLLFDVAEATVEDTDLVGLQFEGEREVGFQKLQGVDALGEDDEAVAFVVRVPADGFFGFLREQGKEVLVFRKVLGGDFGEGFEEGFQFADVGADF